MFKTLDLPICQGPLKSNTDQAEEIFKIVSEIVLLSIILPPINHS
jgi:hypothetical protein